MSPSVGHACRVVLTSTIQITLELPKVEVKGKKKEKKKPAVPSLDSITLTLAKFLIQY